jgi:serine/threonine protein kinase
LPEIYDDNLKTIHFDASIISLMTLKKRKDFKFSSEHLVHIFTRLLEFVLMLSEEGYCHSDLKPENISLVHVS